MFLCACMMYSRRNMKKKYTKSTLATYLVMTESPKKKPERSKYFLSLFFKKTKRLKVESPVRTQSMASELMIREMPSNTGENPMKMVAKVAALVPNNFFVRK